MSVPGFLTSFSGSFFPQVERSAERRMQQKRYEDMLRQQQDQMAQRKELIDYQRKEDEANRLAVLRPDLVEQAQGGVMNVDGVPGGYLNREAGMIRDYASPQFLMRTMDRKTPEEEMANKLRLYDAQKQIDMRYAPEPLTFEQQIQLRKAGANKQYIDMRGEEKFSEKTAEAASKRFDSVLNEANNAQVSLANIGAARAILESGKLDTGRLAPLKAQVASIAQAFNIDPNQLGLEKADSAQAFYAVTMKNLLQELATQKGPQTEGDAERAMKTFVRMGNTPEANVFILNYAEALAMRKREQANFIEEKMANLGGQNRKNFRKAEKAWTSRISKVPLFRSNPKTGLPVTYYRFMEVARNAGMTEKEATAKWLSEGR